MTEQLYRAKLPDNDGHFDEVVLYVGMYSTAPGWESAEIGFIPAEPTLYKEDIREYLDTAIYHWRAKQKLGDGNAEYYIDAFQSMRSSVLGSLLAEDKT